ncbi:MAG: phosphate ABC transporter permease PstA [Planctomycetota bacterium]
MRNSELQIRSAGLGRSRWSAAISSVAALAVVATFGWICIDIVRHGISVIDWEFLTAEVEDAGRAGGIAPVILSTVFIVGICMAAVVPLGLTSAIYLAEFARRRDLLGRTTRGALDTLAAVPSIVFGLFGHAFFGVTLGLGSSLLCGGLTLACMVLPLFVRTTELGLRGIDPSQRGAGAALGLTRTAIAFRIVLPQATPAIVAGLILGVARALAETAALIFTSGYVTRTPTSWFDSGRTLSVHIYDLALNVYDGEDRAYGAALVLMALLFASNRLAAWTLRLWRKKALR